MSDGEGVVRVVAWIRVVVTPLKIEKGVLMDLVIEGVVMPFCLFFFFFFFLSSSRFKEVLLL